MSRIVVIGAHGRTGLLIVEQLLKAGDSVVAVIRNPRQMADLVKRGAETVLLDLEASSGPAPGASAHPHRRRLAPRERSVALLC